MTAKAPPAVTIGPMARPSRPSVRFTALDAPTITRTAKGIQSQPRVEEPALEERDRELVVNPSGGHQ